MRPRELDDRDRQGSTPPPAPLHTTPTPRYAARALPEESGPPLWAMVAMCGFAIYGIIAWSVGSVMIVLELMRVFRA